MTWMNDLESECTLSSAVVRYEALRLRDAMSDPDGETPGPEALSRAEALEMLALGEVIARKAGYGRQLAVRTARSVGASWAQIGVALSTSRQSAWEAHTKWIDAQAGHHADTGYEGFDDDAERAARGLAGGRPAETVQ